MKVLLLILVLGGLVSCMDQTRKENVYVCNCEQQKAASKFVSDNMKAANNMSDEEMEDVISQLERTGVKLNCPKKRLKVVRNGEGYIKDVLGLKPGETSYEEY
jgi:hypothetical protein